MALNLKSAGEILRRTRLDQETTQADVVFAVKNRGVVSLSDAHYRRLEAGLSLPSVILAMEICAVLGVDVYEVWGAV